MVMIMELILLEISEENISVVNKYTLSIHHQVFA